MAEQQPVSQRIVSLDQFRGYTVLGMFLVNFVGGYASIRAAAPVLIHHHTYCSYADTIMPQFFLAVGFAYRMTFLRRMETQGTARAYGHAIRRNLGLLLVAFVIHHLDGGPATYNELMTRGVRGFFIEAFQRNFFQTLTHIAITSIWVLPVIGARPTFRVAYAILSGILFHILSMNGYYEWVLKRPGIDGGPLGFLTWTIPLIVGTLAYDLMATVKRPVVQFLAMGFILMLLGYGFSCLNRVPSALARDVFEWELLFLEPPFVPPWYKIDIWTMSQRAGSVSYLTFGAGFSLFVLGLFVLMCDVLPLKLGVFRTLGTNALAAYIIHDLVNTAVERQIPRDSPTWFVFIGFGVSLAICYVFLRHLQKNRLYLRM